MNMTLFDVTDIVINTLSIVSGYYLSYLKIPVLGKRMAVQLE